MVGVPQRLVASVVQADAVFVAHFAWFGRPFDFAQDKLTAGGSAECSIFTLTPAAAGDII